MREQKASSGEVWGGVDLSDSDRELTFLFSLSKTTRSMGMDVAYDVDYAIVKDWCDIHECDPIETMVMMKSMANVMNEKS